MVSLVKFSPAGRRRGSGFNPLAVRRWNRAVLTRGAYLSVKYLISSRNNSIRCLIRDPEQRADPETRWKLAGKGVLLKIMSR